jgi:hypothetical protein
MNGPLTYWTPSVSRQQEEHAEYLDRIVSGREINTAEPAHGGRSAEVLDGGCRLYKPCVARWTNSTRKGL